MKIEANITNKEDVQYQLEIQFSYKEISKITKALRTTEYDSTTTEFIRKLEDLTTKIDKQLKTNEE